MLNIENKKNNIEDEIKLNCDDTIKGINVIRNRVYGHRMQNDKDWNDLFKEANIIPNKLKDLIDFSSRILNEIIKEIGIKISFDNKQLGISLPKPSVHNTRIDDVRNLLDDLKKYNDNKEKPKINEEILTKGGLPHYKFFDNIAELPYVEAIYLFGSRARGDFWQHSDIDLAIKYNSDEVMHRRIVKVIAEEIADTALDIDIVDYGDIGKEFKKQIDSEKVTIYENT